MSRCEVSDQPRCRADDANCSSFRFSPATADQNDRHEVEQTERNLVTREIVQESNQDIQEDREENYEKSRLSV